MSYTLCQYCSSNEFENENVHTMTFVAKVCLRKLSKISHLTQLQQNYQIRQLRSGGATSQVTLVFINKCSVYTKYKKKTIKD